MKKELRNLSTNRLKRWRKACIESIEHWQKDIIDKFDAGFMTDDFHGRWINPQKGWTERIEDTSKHCALCKEMWKWHEDCKNCPLNTPCDNPSSVWVRWKNNMTRENAVNMQDAIKRALKSIDKFLAERKGVRGGD